MYFLTDLRPSLSCILFGNRGCAIKCNILGYMYRYKSWDSICDGVYCDCREKYDIDPYFPLDKLPKNLPFKKLLGYRFLRTPVFRDLVKTLKNQPKLKAEVVEFLRYEEGHGPELKQKFKKLFPEIKPLLKRLKPRPPPKPEMDVSAEVYKKGIENEDPQNAVLDTVRKWWDKPKKFDINSDDNKNRIIDLIKGIKDKDDLLKTLQMLKDSGEKPLFNGVVKHFLLKGLTMPDGTEIVKGDDNPKTIEKRINNDEIFKKIEEKIKEDDSKYDDLSEDSDEEKPPAKGLNKKRKKSKPIVENVSASEEDSKETIKRPVTPVVPSIDKKILRPQPSVAKKAPLAKDTTPANKHPEVKPSETVQQAPVGSSWWNPYSQTPPKIEMPKVLDKLPITEAEPSNQIKTPLQVPDKSKNVSDSKALEMDKKPSAVSPWWNVLGKPPVSNTNKSADKLPDAKEQSPSSNWWNVLDQVKPSSSIKIPGISNVLPDLLKSKTKADAANKRPSVPPSFTPSVGPKIPDVKPFDFDDFFSSEATTEDKSIDADDTKTQQITEKPTPGSLFSNNDQSSAKSPVLNKKPLPEAHPILVPPVMDDSDESDYNPIFKILNKYPDVVTPQSPAPTAKEKMPNPAAIDSSEDDVGSDEDVSSKIETAVPQTEGLNSKQNMLDESEIDLSDDDYNFWPSSSKKDITKKIPSSGITPPPGAPFTDKSSIPSSGEFDESMTDTPSIADLKKNIHPKPKMNHLPNSSPIIDALELEIPQPQTHNTEESNEQSDEEIFIPPKPVDLISKLRNKKMNLPNSQESVESEQVHDAVEKLNNYPLSFSPQQYNKNTPAKSPKNQDFTAEKIPHDKRDEKVVQPTPIPKVSNPKIESSDLNTQPSTDSAAAKDLHNIPDTSELLEGKFKNPKNNRKTPTKSFPKTTKNIPNVEKNFGGNNKLEPKNDIPEIKNEPPKLQENEVFKHSKKNTPIPQGMNADAVKSKEKILGTPDGVLAEIPVGINPPTKILANIPFPMPNVKTNPISEKEYHNPLSEELGDETEELETENSRFPGNNKKILDSIPEVSPDTFNAKMKSKRPSLHSTSINRKLNTKPKEAVNEDSTLLSTEYSEERVINTPGEMHSKSSGSLTELPKINHLPIFETPKNSEFLPEIVPSKSGTKNDRPANNFNLQHENFQNGNSSMKENHRPTKSNRGNQPPVSLPEAVTPEQERNSNNPDTASLFPQSRTKNITPSKSANPQDANSKLQSLPTTEKPGDFYVSLPSVIDSSPNGDLDSPEKAITSPKRSPRKKVANTEAVSANGPLDSTSLLQADVPEVVPPSPTLKQKAKNIQLGADENPKTENISEAPLSQLVIQAPMTQSAPLKSKNKENLPQYDINSSAGSYEAESLPLIQSVGTLPKETAPKTNGNTPKLEASSAKPKRKRSKKTTPKNTNSAVSPSSKDKNSEFPSSLPSESVDHGLQINSNGPASGTNIKKPINKNGNIQTVPDNQKAVSVNKSPKTSVAEIKMDKPITPKLKLINNSGQKELSQSPVEGLMNPEKLKNNQKTFTNPELGANANEPTDKFLINENTATKTLPAGRVTEDLGPSNLDVSDVSEEILNTTFPGKEDETAGGNVHNLPLGSKNVDLPSLKNITKAPRRGPGFTLQTSFPKDKLTSSNEKAIQDAIGPLSSEFTDFSPENDAESTVLLPVAQPIMVDFIPENTQETSKNSLVPKKGSKQPSANPNLQSSSEMKKKSRISPNIPVVPQKLLKIPEVSAAPIQQTLSSSSQISDDVEKMVQDIFNEDHNDWEDVEFPEKEDDLTKIFLMPQEDFNPANEVPELDGDSFFNLPEDEIFETKSPPLKSFFNIPEDEIFEAKKTPSTNPPLKSFFNMPEDEIFEAEKPPSKSQPLKSFFNLPEDEVFEPKKPPSASPPLKSFFNMSEDEIFEPKKSPSTSPPLKSFFSMPEDEIFETKNPSSKSFFNMPEDEIFETKNPPSKSFFNMPEDEIFETKNPALKSFFNMPEDEIFETKNPPLKSFFNTPEDEIFETKILPSNISQNPDMPKNSEKLLINNLPIFSENTIPANPNEISDKVSPEDDDFLSVESTEKLPDEFSAKSPSNMFSNPIQKEQPQDKSKTRNSPNEKGLKFDNNSPSKMNNPEEMNQRAFDFDAISNEDDSFFHDFFNSNENIGIPQKDTGRDIFSTPLVADDETSEGDNFFATPDDLRNDKDASGILDQQLKTESSLLPNSKISNRIPDTTKNSPSSPLANSDLTKTLSMEIIQNLPDTDINEFDFIRPKVNSDLFSEIFDISDEDLMSDLKNNQNNSSYSPYAKTKASDVNVANGIPNKDPSAFYSKKPFNPDIPPPSFFDLSNDDSFMDDDTQNFAKPGTVSNAVKSGPQDQLLKSIDPDVEELSNNGVNLPKKNSAIKNKSQGGFDPMMEEMKKAADIETDDPHHGTYLGASFEDEVTDSLVKPVNSGRKPGFNITPISNALSMPLNTKAPVTNQNKDIKIDQFPKNNSAEKSLSDLFSSLEDNSWDEQEIHKMSDPKGLSSWFFNKFRGKPGTEDVMPKPTGPNLPKDQINSHLNLATPVPSNDDGPEGLSKENTKETPRPNSGLNSAESKTMPDLNKNVKYPADSFKNILEDIDEEIPWDEADTSNARSISAAPERFVNQSSINPAKANINVKNPSPNVATSNPKLHNFDVDDENLDDIFADNDDSPGRIMSVPSANNLEHPENFSANELLNQSKVQENPDVNQNSLENIVKSLDEEIPWDTAEEHQSVDRIPDWFVAKSTAGILAPANSDDNADFQNPTSAKNKEDQNSLENIVKSLDEELPWDDADEHQFGARIPDWFAAKSKAGMPAKANADDLGFPNPTKIQNDENQNFLESIVKSLDEEIPWDDDEVHQSDERILDWFAAKSTTGTPKPDAAEADSQNPGNKIFDSTEVVEQHDEEIMPTMFPQKSGMSPEENKIKFEDAKLLNNVLDDVETINLDMSNSNEDKEQFDIAEVTNLSASDNIPLNNLDEALDPVGDDPQKVSNDFPTTMDSNSSPGKYNKHTPSQNIFIPKNSMMEWSKEPLIGAIGEDLSIDDFYDSSETPTNLISRERQFPIGKKFSNLNKTSSELNTKPITNANIDEDISVDDFFSLSENPTNLMPDENKIASQDIVSNRNPASDSVIPDGLSLEDVYDSSELPTNLQSFSTANSSSYELNKKPPTEAKIVGDLSVDEFAWSSENPTALTPDGNKIPSQNKFFPIKNLSNKRNIQPKVDAKISDQSVDNFVDSFEKPMNSVPGGSKIPSQNDVTTMNNVVNESNKNTALDSLIPEDLSVDVTHNSWENPSNLMTENNKIPLQNKFLKTNNASNEPKMKPIVDANFGEDLSVEDFFNSSENPTNLMFKDNEIPSQNKFFPVKNISHQQKMNPTTDVDFSIDDLFSSSENPTNLMPKESKIISQNKFLPVNNISKEPKKTNPAAETNIRENLSVNFFNSSENLTNLMSKESKITLQNKSLPVNNISNEPRMTPATVTNIGEDLSVDDFFNSSENPANLRPNENKISSQNKFSPANKVSNENMKPTTDAKIFDDLSVDDFFKSSEKPPTSELSENKIPTRNNFSLFRNTSDEVKNKPNFDEDISLDYFLKSSEMITNSMPREEEVSLEDKFSPLQSISGESNEKTNPDATVAEKLSPDYLFISSEKLINLASREYEVPIQHIFSPIRNMSNYGSESEKPKSDANRVSENITNEPKRKPSIDASIGEKISDNIFNSSENPRMPNRNDALPQNNVSSISNIRTKPLSKPSTGVPVDEDQPFDNFLKSSEKPMNATPNKNDFLPQNNNSSFNNIKNVPKSRPSIGASIGENLSIDNFYDSSEETMNSMPNKSDLLPQNHISSSKNIKNKPNGKLTTSTIIEKDLSIEDLFNLSEEPLISIPNRNDVLPQNKISSFSNIMYEPKSKLSTGAGVDEDLHIDNFFKSSENLMNAVPNKNDVLPQDNASLFNNLNTIPRSRPSIGTSIDEDLSMDNFFNSSEKPMDSIPNMDVDPPQENGLSFNDIINEPKSELPTGVSIDEDLSFDNFFRSSEDPKISIPNRNDVLPQNNISSVNNIKNFPKSRPTGTAIDEDLPTDKFFKLSENPINAVPNKNDVLPQDNASLFNNLNNIPRIRPSIRTSIGEDLSIDNFFNSSEKPMDSMPNKDVDLPLKNGSSFNNIISEPNIESPTSATIGKYLPIDNFFNSSEEPIISMSNRNDVLPQNNTSSFSNIMNQPKSNPSNSSGIDEDLHIDNVFISPEKPMNAVSNKNDFLPQNNISSFNKIINVPKSKSSTSASIEDFSIDNFFNSSGKVMNSLPKENDVLPPNNISSLNNIIRAPKSKSLTDASIEDFSINNFLNPSEKTMNSMLNKDDVRLQNNMSSLTKPKGKPSTGVNLSEDVFTDDLFNLSEKPMNNIPSKSQPQNNFLSFNRDLNKLKTKPTLYDIEDMSINYFFNSSEEPMNFIPSDKIDTSQNYFISDTVSKPTNDPKQSPNLIEDLYPKYFLNSSKNPENFTQSQQVLAEPVSEDSMPKSVSSTLSEIAANQNSVDDDDWTIDSSNFHTVPNINKPSGRYTQPIKKSARSLLTPDVTQSKQLLEPIGSWEDTSQLVLAPPKYKTGTPNSDSNDDAISSLGNTEKNSSPQNISNPKNNLSNDKNQHKNNLGGDTAHIPEVANPSSTVSPDSLLPSIPQPLQTSPKTETPITTMNNEDISVDFGSLENQPLWPNNPTSKLSSKNADSTNFPDDLEITITSAELDYLSWEDKNEPEFNSSNESTNEPLNKMRQDWQNDNSLPVIINDFQSDNSGSILEKSSETKFINSDKLVKSEPNVKNETQKSLTNSSSTASVQKPSEIPFEYLRSGSQNSIPKNNGQLMSVLDETFVSEETDASTSESPFQFGKRAASKKNLMELLRSKHKVNDSQNHIS